ncbi:MAG: PqqD family protein [Pseudomonadota bacterium]
MFKRHEEVLLESFGEELLVFDLRNHLPYTLNGTASFILRNTDGRQNPESIAEKVCHKFEVEYEEALQGVHALYGALQTKGIIEPAGEEELLRFAPPLE